MNKIQIKHCEIGILVNKFCNSQKTINRLIQVHKAYAQIATDKYLFIY